LATDSDLPKLFGWHARFQPEMSEQQLDCDQNTKERQPATPELLQDENLLQLSLTVKTSDLTLPQVTI